MHAIGFIIELKSDAEPGTGTGGDIINDRVPRNSEGLPIIPATHLKGLIREELQKLEFLFKETDKIFENLADECAGKPGAMNCSGDGDDGQEACFFLTDATSEGTVTSYVSRTALDMDSGTAKETSLRTTERIPVGTKFSGKLVLNVPLDSRKGIAVQLALFSIAAIGGGRNRGCGQCVIQPEQSFGAAQLGKMFEKLCTAKDQDADEPPKFDAANMETVTLQLIFEAESPVCCPETPVRGNIIKSGFVIPASAVQGFIVNHVAEKLGNDAATNCFESENFRAWPLLPCARNIDENHHYPVPTRVSLTHRVAKLISDGENIGEKKVADLAIEEYNWAEADPLNPLKASDGVLLRFENTVELWKSRSMPRIISAHGVLNDPNTDNGRNLFQIESMAPIVWSGIVRVPKFVADTLIGEQTAFFGRNRSIRGMGTLIVKPLGDDEKSLPWNMENTAAGMSQAVVVQSPVLLDIAIPKGESATGVVEKFVKDKWGDVVSDIKVHGSVVGIQFGWNCTGVDQLSNKRTGKGSRVQACRVIQPGAVIVFNHHVEKELLAKCIQNGLGKGREQGFGAVALHPGKATRMFGQNQKDRRPVVSNFNEKAAIEEALKIWRDHRNNLPSASQIAAVRDILYGNNENPQQKALDYLNRQKSERTAHIWAVWEKCFDDVKDYVKKYEPQWSVIGLKLIMDLRISESSDQQEEM